MGLFTRLYVLIVAALKPSFPTSPGVWSPSNGAENCNLAAVKIAFNLAGVAGSVRSSIKESVNDTTGCVPLTVTFSDTLHREKDMYGTLVTIHLMQRLQPLLSPIPIQQLALIRVRLVSIDSAKCNVADTAYTNIVVKTFKAFPDFLSRKVGVCESFNYEFRNTSSFRPQQGYLADTSFTWNLATILLPLLLEPIPVTHSFPGPGEYLVKLALTDTNFCNAPTDTTKIIEDCYQCKS